MLKICRTCHFYTYGVCKNAPVGEPDVVDGCVTYKPCREERAQLGGCGPEGKYYKPLTWWDRLISIVDSF